MNGLGLPPPDSSHINTDSSTNQSQSTANLPKSTQSSQTSSNIPLGRKFQSMSKSFDKLTNLLRNQFEKATSTEANSVNKKLAIDDNPTQTSLGSKIKELATHIFGKKDTPNQESVSSTTKTQFEKLFDIKLDLIKQSQTKIAASKDNKEVLETEKKWAQKQLDELKKFEWSETDQVKLNFLKDKYEKHISTLTTKINTLSESENPESIDHSEPQLPLNSGETIQSKNEMGQESVSKTLKLTDASGLEKQGHIGLPPGDHVLSVTWGKEKGTTREFKTEAPVYFFSDAQFGKMNKSCACLIMDKSDFEILKGKIHSGAFGSDYQDFGDNQVLIWKLPGDLKDIDNWIPSTELTKNAVGEYLTVDYFKTHDQNTKNKKQNQKPIDYGLATKFRMDLPKKDVVSVHHLEFEGGKKQAMFSLGNICKNFNYPTTEEKESIKNLIKELGKVGIKAYYCDTHHAIVLEKNPSALAEMLENPKKGQAIKKALLSAAKDDFKPKMDEWAANFIQVYRKTT